MSLFSFLRKNKQESASADSTFYSRAEEDSKAVRSRGKRRQGKQTGAGAESLDPVLPEKKRARRRLIGAVALVLAAIIGLPMVLDSEPKPLADDIAIQIPSKDKLPAGSTVRPDAAAASKVAASASLDPKEEMVEPATASSAVESKPDPKAETTASAAPAPAASTKAGEADKPVSEMASVNDKPANKPVSPKADAKTEIKAAVVADDVRAKALLEGKPDPAKTTEKKSGKFVIQVAALATKDKVNDLQSKLQSAGIKSYTEKLATESGERTRIRVGPFSSKEEAEKVRGKIVKLGLNGTLVPA